MKKLLVVLAFLFSSSLFSQNLIQTYVDRCTGEVKVFSVPMNGQTVVAFYNKSKTFTAEDFRNGNLQFWLEETYLWWSSLNPCSTTTTGAVTTQQTTQQVTQQATQAATNAVATTANTTVDVPSTPLSTPQASAPPETPTTVVDTPSTDTSAATTDIGSQPSTSEPTTSTDTSGAAETTNTENQTSTDQTETSSTETTQSSDENTTSDQPNETSGEADSNETETTSEESTSSSESEEQEVEETSSDESAEDSTEESSEETTEENSEEDTTEEESSEESEEESQEESSDEEEESDEEASDSSEDSEEEEDNKKKRKRALAPPILTANVMSMQDPLGNFSTAVNIGMSQSSLMGDKTYGLNAMVYSNMQQFMLTANFSKVHINDKGRVNRVYSASIGGAKMYTTYMAMTNHSLVFLGKKGSVFGTALGLNLTSLELDIREGYIYYDEQILGASLTTFYTKPFNFDRLTISPMLAASAPFASMDLYFGDGISFNKDVMFITGSSFNYQLTKRFIANIGANAISATIKDFPVIWSFTIGSRFQF